MRHTNIKSVKIIIILKKAKDQKLSKRFLDTTTLAEVAQVLSLVDFAWIYIWAISNVNMDIAKKLGLIEVKKYRKHTSQVEMKFDWPYN